MKADNLIFPVILIGGGLIAFKTFFKGFSGEPSKEQKKQAEVIKNKIKDQEVTEKPSYTNESYFNLADKIQAAGNTFFGTNEKVIFAAFKLMKTNLDVLKLIDAFGFRRLEYTTTLGSLSMFLISELNTNELNTIKKDLSDKGITVLI